MERAIRRRSTQPEAIAAADTIRVSCSYMGEETSREKHIHVRKFEVEPAYVRVNVGSTKNMGNYESLRVDVSITMPCYAEEVDKVLPKLADKVGKYLDEELQKYE